MLPLRNYILSFTKVIIMLIYIFFHILKLRYFTRKMSAFSISVNVVNFIIYWITWHLHYNSHKGSTPLSMSIIRHQYVCIIRARLLALRRARDIFFMSYITIIWFPHFSYGLIRFINILSLAACHWLVVWDIIIWAWDMRYILLMTRHRGFFTL